jgi:hypothetical protein
MPLLEDRQRLAVRRWRPPRSRGPPVAPCALGGLKREVTPEHTLEMMEDEEVRE